DHWLLTHRVAGGTIAALADQTPLGARAVTGVLVDLARVVDSVHRAGWVHGRIEGDHVLVDSERRVVLGGFGRVRRDVHGRTGAEGRADDVAQLALLARSLLSREPTDEGSGLDA